MVKRGWIYLITARPGCIAAAVGTATPSTAGRRFAPPHARLSLQRPRLPPSEDVTLGRSYPLALLRSEIITEKKQSKKRRGNERSEAKRRSEARSEATRSEFPEADWGLQKKTTLPRSVRNFFDFSIGETTKESFSEERRIEQEWKGAITQPCVREGARTCLLGPPQLGIAAVFVYFGRDKTTSAEPLGFVAGLRSGGKGER